MKGEKAHKDAIAMGLKYKGFGYWADPTTGETKFKTENDTLVPVEAEQESEKYQGTGVRGIPGQDGGGGGMMPGMGGGAMGGQMMGPGGRQVQPGSTVKGAPDPGKELAPFGDEITNWRPGPKGDTCVGPGSEQPAEVPRDSFVRKTNYYAWAAGPNGSNITNVKPEQMEESRSIQGIMRRLGDIDRDAQRQALSARRGSGGKSFEKKLPAIFDQLKTRQA